MSNLSEGSMDSEIHVTSSQYVTGQVGIGTPRNAVLNFAQFSALS